MKELKTQPQEQSLKMHNRTGVPVQSPQSSKEQPLIHFQIAPY